MTDMLKACIYLNGILPLMEDLVSFDTTAAHIIRNRNLVLQFEVKNGPSSHLIIKNNTIRHGNGKHPAPSVRLTFKTPDLLNRMFAGEDVRPGFRKGFFHLLFLLKKFPLLSDRLTYYLEGDGKHPTDTASLNFLVTMGLHAMLQGMKTVAEEDPELKSIAEDTPFGTLVIRILPDGPFGTFSKFPKNDRFSFAVSLNKPIRHANAVMEFANADAAKKMIDGQLNAVTAIGIGKDIKIRGLLPLIDKASIFLYKFAKIMES